MIVGSLPVCFEYLFARITKLREDLRKGGCVENLTKHTVRIVNDVLQLLQQGAANNNIAVTHLNSESSRSHSVFTYVVESQWEKDSTTHYFWKTEFSKHCWF